MRIGLRRRLAGRWGLWLLTTGITVLAWLLMVDTSWQVHQAVKHDEAVTATISRIETDDADYTTTHVTVDGQEYVLEGFPPLFDIGDIRRVLTSSPDYAVGDTLTVALDPDPDPDDNWAYDVSRYEPFKWWQALLGLAFMTSVVGYARAFFTRDWLVRDGLRWQVWWRAQVKEAKVLEVRSAPEPTGTWLVASLLRAWLVDGNHPHHVLVVELGDRVHLWQVKTERTVLIEPGTTFNVIGRPRSHGWIVGLTSPPLYPTSRLD